jgi:hypothetical protein
VAHGFGFTGGPVVGLGEGEGGVQVLDGGGEFALADGAFAEELVGGGGGGAVGWRYLQGGGGVVAGGCVCA